MPRPAVTGHGLPNFGQVLFPDEPLNLGLDRVLTDVGQRYVNVSSRDSAGGKGVTWQSSGDPFRARIRPAGRSDRITVGLEPGDKATHMIYTDIGITLNLGDRIEISGGARWEVLSVEHQTGQFIQSVAVKGALS